MRLSQIFWFLTVDKAPTERELRHYYTHLDVDDDLKKLGKARRLERARMNRKGIRRAYPGHPIDTDSF